MYPWLAAPNHPAAMRPPPPPPEVQRMGGSAKGWPLPPMFGDRNHADPTDKVQGSVWGNVDSSDKIFYSQLAAMLAEQLPKFAAEIGGSDPDGVAVRGARVRRQTSWIELTSGSYETMHGAIVLVGDAAHGMTPSIGEGCNYALDSALRLAQVCSNARGA